MPIATKNLRVNESIRVPQIRLIDLSNEQVGIISTAEALEMAREKGVDLVEVAPNGEPPVCRLMDYGKLKYDQKKKDHRARVKQHNVVLKEIRLRPKTEIHDRMVKLKKARQFLEKGSKVQFTMLFRGREVAHLDLAIDLVDEVMQELGEVCKVEMPPRRQGRKMTMLVAPTAVK